MSCGPWAGLVAQEPQLNFALVRHHAAAVLAAAGPNYTQARLEAMNVTVIRGQARFTSPGTCEAAGRTIEAHRFAVATGAVAKRLTIPGLDLVRPLTCAALCALDSPPSHFIVSWKRPGRLALAQAMRRFGSDVWLCLQRGTFSRSKTRSWLSQCGLLSPVTASSFMKMCGFPGSSRAAAAYALLIAAPGEVHPVTGYRSFRRGWQHTCRGGTGPWRPAQGCVTAKPGIATNAALVTSNRRIYAIGAAVTGVRGESGAAEHHATHVWRAILGLPGRRLPRLEHPCVILTSPALAVTGLSESQARAAYHHIQVLRWPFAETGKARIRTGPPGMSNSSPAGKAPFLAPELPALGPKN